ncbi:hypothetical protein LCGC14_2261820, partial [marine sediment metagenome]
HSAVKKELRDLRNQQPPLCGCGCKEKVTWGGYSWSIYIQGHNMRGKKGSKKSLEARLKALRGIKKSKEHRRKISESTKGREVSDETRLKSSISHLEYFSDMENRIKQSCALQGVSREEWKGFSSKEHYCVEWTNDLKEYIKERDNYECQNPDCTDKSNHLPLYVHHIDYDKKNCSPNNLITLCNSCHSQSNGNRDQWQKLYTKIIKKKYK